MKTLLISRSIKYGLILSLCLFINSLSTTGQALHNKVYHIKVKHSGKYLDVHNWSKANGGNIVQWDLHGGTNQQFRFKHAEGDYYYIQSVYSKKYLHVHGASTANDGNITQWAYTDVPHMQFKFKYAEDGYYYYVVKHSGKYLQIADGSKSNGASLVQHSSSGGAHQQFKIESILRPAREKFHNKVVRITARHSNKSWDLKKKSKAYNLTIVQNKYSTANRQAFKLFHAGGGYYYIKNLYSGLYLNVANSAKTNGAQLRQNHKLRLGGGPNHNYQFQIVAPDGGLGYDYYLRARHSGKYLTVVGHSQNDGAGIRQYTLSKETNQRFMIKPFAPLPKVDIEYQPAEGNALVYQVCAPVSENNTATGQLYVTLKVYNRENHGLLWNTVTYSYKESGKTVSKKFHVGRKIKKGGAVRWQNERDYWEMGDVITFRPPFPSEVTFHYDFHGKRQFSQTKKLKPYQHPTPSGRHAFPFNARDFGTNEYVSGAALHGGGVQVFALDVGAYLYDGLGNASDLIDASTGRTQNENYVCYGKPIYAIADGEVLSFLNEVPNNPRPCSDPVDEGECIEGMDMANFSAHSIPGHDAGNGNSFIIKSGDEEIVYAHMVERSLNPDLLVVGAKVKKGDFLGLLGNSGHSTAPHLHLGVEKVISGIRYPRPIFFEGAKAVSRDIFMLTRIFGPDNVPWAEMTGHTLPPVLSFIQPE